MAKKYVSLGRLSDFLDNLKGLFATKSEMDEKSKVQMITLGDEESSIRDIPTLKIHKMSQEQYEQALANGAIDESALYLTPDEDGYTQVEIDEIMSGKADVAHTHTIDNVTNLQTELDGKVPTSRTVNGKSLAGDVTLSASDVGAAPSSHDHNDEYYIKSEVDSKLSDKSDKTHNHDSVYADIDHNHDGVYATAGHNHDSKYDAKGAAAAVQTNLNTVSDTIGDHTSNADIHFTASERTKLSGIAAGAQVNTVTGVKGGSESTYRTGNINITKANIGLGNVDNTADANKSVKHATTADSATSATKATQDGNGKVISSTYETKTDASAKLTEAKTYADNAASAVKNDLLNNAGAAYDTLKELGDLIDDNKDAIEALEDIAAGKANATHTHAISDVTNLQSALDGKANSSHGTHVTYSTAAPVMDGTASVGSASTVARSDHKHPTDTSRASKSEFDSHTGNTTVHITSIERTNWNAAKTHADSAHAPSNAQPNQNAFSNIAVSGQTTVAADTATDTVTFAGSNVSITTDATNDKVTFSVADGTTSAKGVVQLTNSTSSTSTTTAATPNSVKSAYDLANTAKTNAATAQTRADSAYSLAESKVDSLSDFGITATATELNYMDGVTSNVQTQLDSKANGTHNHSADNITSGTLSSDRLPTVPVSKGGTGATSAAAARTNLQITPENIGAVKKTGDTMSGSLTVQMDTDTAPQLTLKGEANGSGQRTSTIVRKYAFANSDYGTEIEDKTFNGSYTKLGLNTTATTPAEKIILKNRTYSSDGSYSDKTYKLYGEHNKPTPSDIGLTATATELNYVDGVTSNIQAQIDSKLDANAITGAASTIISDDLTTNRVLISDSYGKVVASNISGGELSRLSGATKNIQEQIDDLDETVDNKVSKYGDTMTGSLAIEPTSTTSPLISLIGNANASGQQAKSRFRKGTNSSVDNGTEIVDETFDGRKTSLILQSNKDLDKNRLRLKLTAADGTYEEYNLYGEHYKPTAADLGALGNSSYDLHSFVTDRNVMYASNIVSDDVIPFVDVSLRSGRKITMTEFLKYISNNSSLASVAAMTTAEYTALEEAEATNANTLYMLTDAEEEAPTQVQIITWEDDD